MSVKINDFNRATRALNDLSREHRQVRSRGDDFAVSQSKKITATATLVFGAATVILTWKDFRKMTTKSNNNFRRR